MSKKYRLALRNLSNVAASKTALLDCPIGPRYHYVVFQHGYASGTNTVAAACTNINEVRHKVNGKVQRTASGTQLRDMNILNGTQYDCQGVPNTAPGVSVPVYFAEPWRESPQDQDSLALSTTWFNSAADAAAGKLQSLASMQFEVDLLTASTPTLIAWAVVDNFVPVLANGPGMVKWIRQSIPAAGTKFDYTQFDKRDFLQQISLYPDSGGSNAATPVTFRLNGETLHELTTSANFALLTNHGMTPTASGRTSNIYDLVFDHDDLLGSAVNMTGARDASLTIEAASAMSGTIIAIVQRYGPPE